MSLWVGLDALNLRPAARLGHTEYCDHDPLVHQVEAATGRSFRDAWEYDLVWATDDGPEEWASRGRVTDMGHAEFLADGSDRRPSKPSPFTEVSQVLEFDAAREYGLDDIEALVRHYEAAYRKGRRENPDQVFTGGRYKTLVSGAIESFGWEMLLAAAAEQGAFERVLDSFFRLSLHHARAWARTSIEAYICHDDMVWSEGAFMHPDFYRRAIFPRYAELWRPLREAGKKVLFCSDGNFIEFLDDVAAAGADGFIFEPMVPLEEVVRRYGRTHVVVGSKVDCRTMTFGTKEAVRAEIDSTLELAWGCPGFIFAVGNHIPANVPVETALFYFDYLRKRWGRNER
jgi:hypothetical protein